MPMPLGSESALGLAGPNGTPDIDELPAPAEPAGGVNCANAPVGAIKANDGVYYRYPVVGANP